MKYYIGLKKNDAATHLRVEMYYNIGGMNYFTGRQERRGYYLSISPVTRNGIMESFTAYSGVKFLLKEVSRKSAKAEKQAEDLATELAPDYIDIVCRRNGVELEA